MRVLASILCLLFVGVAWAEPAGVCPDGRININAANAAAFTDLKGIGKKKAAKIIADRAQNGPFASIDALTRVKGVGKKSVAKWAARVTTDCKAKIAVVENPDKTAPVAAVDNTDQVVKPINVNKATAADLTGIKGIGKKTAAAIIALRDQKKGFKSLDELTEVKGLGKKKLAKIRARLTLK